MDVFRNENGPRVGAVVCRLASPYLTGPYAPSTRGRGSVLGAARDASGQGAHATPKGLPRCRP